VVLIDFMAIEELTLIIALKPLKLWVLIFFCFLYLHFTLISSQPTEDDRCSYFYLLWSLKEAYIKAIGQGLGYDLKQVNSRSAVISEHYLGIVCLF